MATPDNGALVALDDLDLDILESGFSAVASEKFEQPRFRDRRMQRRFNRNRDLRRHAATRAYRQYLAEGGEGGNVTGFLDWLIANWESIFKIIQSIIGLFGGAAMAPAAAPAKAPRTVRRPTDDGQRVKKKR